MDPSTPTRPDERLPETPRTRFVRRPHRGSHERALIDAILDEALVCHVGVNVDGAPRVLPTAHVRVGDALYVHGARKNRLLGALVAGAPCCVTVTLLDGLVFSRKAFHHSMNYRSVVLYGQANEVTDPEEQRAALLALIEHLAPGRAAEALPPTDEELRATRVVRLPIVEGSAKVRKGPPLDDAELLGHDGWAGELPLRLVALPPRRDPQLPPSRLTEGAVLARARELGLGDRAPYERLRDGYLISTDPQRIDFALVHRFLSQESHGARGISEEALRRSFEHALCFGLYRDGEQLGFARVVTDFARVAYLGDLFVVAAARGRGLGKLLVAEIAGDGLRFFGFR